MDRHHVAEFPWRVHDLGDCPERHVSGADGTPVAHVHSIYDPAQGRFAAEEHARLIGGAPQAFDLLERCLANPSVALAMARAGLFDEANALVNPPSEG